MNIMGIPTINLNLKHYKNEKLNENTLQSDIDTAKKLIHLNTINIEITEKIIEICNDDIKTIETELVASNSSNSSPNVFILKYKFNDGIGDKIVKYFKGHECESYEAYAVFKNYKIIFDMLETYDGITNIIIEKWATQTFLSFNFHYEEIVDRDNNIPIFNKLESNHAIDMIIGEKYWVGQPRKIRIQKPIHSQLLDIVRDGNIYRFIFEGIEENDSPYTITAKGHCDRPNNFNRVEDHIVIHNRLEYFIIDFLKEINSDLGLMGNDSRVKLKESMQDITDIM